MLQKILAACDGSARGRDGVALADTIARAAQARLVLAAVYPDPLMPVPLQLATHAAARERTEIELRRVRDELAPAAELVTAPAFSTAATVRQLAAAEHADLLVVGSSHRRQRRGPLGRGHALEILHGVECAVAVVPDGGAHPGRLATIAVGLDGSDESWDALALGHELARSSGAEVCVCVVVDDHIPASAASWAAAGGGVNFPALLASRHARADALLERARGALAGVTVRTETRLGQPAEQLATLGADLLVVGSARGGALWRLAFGSTSDALIREGTAPVVVAPRGGVRPLVPRDQEDRHVQPRAHRL